MPEIATNTSPILPPKETEEKSSLPGRKDGKALRKIR